MILRNISKIKVKIKKNKMKLKMLVNKIRIIVI